MLLLRRALGLRSHRPVDPPTESSHEHEHDDLPDDPSADLTDDDTQEVSREDAARR